jgi:hypothetical protein
MDIKPSDEEKERRHLENKPIGVSFFVVKFM